MPSQDVVGVDLPGADPVMDRFADLAAMTVGAPMAVLTLLDAEGGGGPTQVLAGAHGLPLRRRDDRRVGPGHLLAGLVLDPAGAVVADDVCHAVSGAALGRLQAAGIRSFVAAPLHGLARAQDDRPLGLLVVMDRDRRAWTEGEQRLLEEVAAAAAGELVVRVTQAICEQDAPGHRHEDQVREVSREAASRSQVLLRLSGLLAAADSAQQVSAALEDVLRRELDVEHFGLLLREPGRAVARYVDMSTFPADADPRWAEVDLRTSQLPVARSITERRAYFFDDREALLAAAPHLEADGPWEFPGAVVTLPLHLGHEVVGALTLVWAQPRSTADPADRVSWLALAHYTAQTLGRVQVTAARRAASEALQRSMLTDLPQWDHLEMRARYLPASVGTEVGGDWYDALVLPDGVTALVIGDVMGHDVAATAGMAQLRTMLRTLAYTHVEPPSLVLEALEETAGGLHVDTLATLLLARVEQSPAQAADRTHTLRWSNAGHLPPVVLCPDGSVEVLRHEPDLPVGVRATQRRSDHTCVVPPSCTVLLLTDGVVERRGHDLDEGVGRLCAALARHASLGLDDLLDAVLADVVSRDHEDDCALLAVRFHPDRAPGGPAQQIGPRPHARWWTQTSAPAPGDRS